MQLPQLFKTSHKGFTLIELVVVMGVLAILIGVAIVAINPSRQYAEARDTQRRSDVSAILNAVHQYIAKNQGTVPAAITAIPTEISTAGSNICALLTPNYLGSLPVDPNTGSGTPITNCAVVYITNYQISRNATTSGQITVAAPGAENGTISITR